MIKRFFVLLLLAVPASATSYDVFTSTKFGAWQVGCSGYFQPLSTWTTTVALSTTNNLNTLRTNWDVWTQLEPGHENYFYSTMDAEVAIATTAAETPIFNIPIHNNTWGLPSGSDTHVPEQILVREYNFVKTTVNRYKSVVHYWEVWNEPDNTSFWNNEAGIPNPQEYLNFLKVAYAAVKAADPTAQVVLGGIAFPYNSNANSWLNQFLALGGGKYFDVMNIHMYGNVGTTGYVGYIPSTGVFTQEMTTTNNTMATYGLTQPVWITELDSINSHYASISSTTEQATFLTQTFTQILSTTTVQRAIWHTLEDCNGLDFGMFYSNGSTKPVANAWAAYQSQLLGYVPQGPVSNNGFYDFKFSSGTTDKFVLWPSTSSQSGASAGSYDHMAVTDMFNTVTTTYSAAAFPAVVFYSTAPVFVQGITNAVIALDTATTSTGASFASPFTWNINIGNGSSAANKVAVLSCTTNDAQTVASASIGGSAMTFQEREALAVSGGLGSEQWYLVNPPTGSQTISVTPNSGTGGGIGTMNCTVTDWVGVSQATPIDISTGTTISGGTSISLSATTTSSGDMIVDSLLVNNSGITLTPGGSQTQPLTSYSNGTQGSTFSGSYKGPQSPAGSQTMSWTFSINSGVQTWVALKQYP